MRFVLKSSKFVKYLSWIDRYAVYDKLTVFSVCLGSVGFEFVAYVVEFFASVEDKSLLFARIGYCRQIFADKSGDGIVYLFCAGKHLDYFAVVFAALVCAF